MLDSLFRIENIHVCFEGGQLGFIGHSLWVISQSSRWPGESDIRGFSPPYEQFLGQGERTSLIPGYHTDPGSVLGLGPCPLAAGGPGAVSLISPCFQMSVTASSGLSPVHFLFC